MSLSSEQFERYQRQLSLPEITAKTQARLLDTRLLVIGAGGLGSAALPYIAASGIGHITVIDNDTVSISNLHRQTIFKNSDAGKNKAEIAAEYVRDLNPTIDVQFVNEKLNSENADNFCKGFDLILDGSDNFETKTLLNKISIETETPLIFASVNQFQGQAGILAGFAKDAPCYHCLFPDLPTDARNCNEAGILGTSAGLTGLYQAHLTLCFLLGLADVGTILTFDFKNFRMQKLSLPKNPDCPHCKDGQKDWQPHEKDKNMTELISMDDLAKREHIIVDVRTDGEIAADPIDGALHMELTTIPQRHDELPKDKLLAFVCAGNIRSVQAAEYLSAMGYNTIVLDKFSL